MKNTIVIKRSKSAWGKNVVLEEVKNLNVEVRVGLIEEEYQRKI